MTISITPAVHEALVSNYSPVTLCPAESAPENGALPNFNQSERQAGLGRLDLRNLAEARDRDRPGLHRLRELAHEVDVQESVLQPCALDHTWSASWKRRSKVRSAMPL
jgi:hypothetical protein